MLGGSIRIGGQTCLRWKLPSGFLRRIRPGRRGSDWTAGLGHLGGGLSVLQGYPHVSRQAGGRCKFASMGN